MNVSFGDEDRPTFVPMKKKMIDFSQVDEEDLLVVKTYLKAKKKSE